MSVIQIKPRADSFISTLSFLERFTDEEAILIDMASIDDPTALMATRLESAKIRRYLQKVNAAQYQDLEDLRLVDGVQVLETNGLIAVGRAVQIIETPIEESERP